MSVQANKEIARKFLDALGKNDFSDLYSPDYVHHNDAWYPGLEPGVANFRAAVERSGKALSNRTREITHLIAEGDMVVARFRVTGVHVGDWGGIPATGKPVSFVATDIYRFEDGKIVEGWAHLDYFDVMRQLGAKPAVG